MTAQRRIPSQMLKGVISGCMLAVIAQGETYGYEISQKLSDYGFGTIAEGTIYPVLLRLEKNGFITASYRPSELGPKRKYYAITEQGESELTNFHDEFGMLAAAVKNLLAGDGRDDSGNDDDNAVSEQSKGAQS